MPNTIKVIEERCTGCTLCVKACPVDCIAMLPSEEARTATKGKLPWKKLAVIDVNRCIFCGACVKVCDDLFEKNRARTPDNFKAIVMEKEAAAGTGVDTTLYKGVWCYAEQRHGKIVPTIYELLQVGRTLAQDLGEPLSAVLIGHRVTASAQDLIEHGADRVYVLDDPLFERFLDEAYTNAFAGLILREKPNKLLLPASTIGRSFASRLAITVHAGITADVTGLAIHKQTGLLYATRPAFGGNLMATILCERHRPEMTTVRPMTFPKAPRVPGRKGEVVQVPVDPSKIRCRQRFVRFDPDQGGFEDISSAERIVSGGRGLGSAQGFELIRQFARALNAAVGASRPTVDAGWIPYRHQVGLTGRTVRPKLYVACGISGQIQHLAGMSSAEVVVAINTDPEAPLMHLATLSVEGNLYEVIPALIRELENQRGGPSHDPALAPGSQVPGGST